MFSISESGIVTVNRGDSFILPVFLNSGNSIQQTEYKLTPTDELYIGVMEPNQPFENAIIRKKFTYDDLEDGHINIKFWPEDTRLLLPGKYYYQVKVQTTDLTTQRKDVITFIDKTLFYIKE